VTGLQSELTIKVRLTHQKNLHFRIHIDESKSKQIILNHFYYAILCAIIESMKTNISITIDEEVLEEAKRSFPDKKRSQIIEDALSFWTKKEQQKRIRLEAIKLLNFQKDLDDIEEDTVMDGLSEL